MVEGDFVVGFFKGCWEICESWDDDGEGKCESMFKFRGWYELYRVYLLVVLGLWFCVFF